MASRINDTFARMSKWLRRTRIAVESERAKDRAKKLAMSAGRKWRLAAGMTTTAVGAVAAYSIARARWR